MNSLTHILVVDDEETICEPLCEHLDRNGFITTAALSAQEAYDALSRESIDLIILDIMMPGEDGLSVCRHISETSKIPVILLTALAEDTDRIIGLEIGADDYITKPFNPRELIARIRAVLRRTHNNETKSNSNHILRFGEWSLDTNLGELINKDDTVIALSTGEMKLLTAFIENPQVILSRDDLLTITQGRDAFPFERSIDNMISRLRGKIETDKTKPIHIQTVWAGGYKFNPHT